MRVRELIRELRQFPDDWKVSLEGYEEDADGYVRHNLIDVKKDNDAKKYVVIRSLEACCLELLVKYKYTSVNATKCRSDKKPSD